MHSFHFVLFLAFLLLGGATAQFGEELFEQIFPVICDFYNGRVYLCISEHNILLHCICFIHRLSEWHVLNMSVIFIVNSNHFVICQRDLFIVQIVPCACHLTKCLDVYLPTTFFADRIFYWCNWICHNSELAQLWSKNGCSGLGKNQKSWKHFNN